MFVASSCHAVTLPRIGIAHKVVPGPVGGNKAELSPSLAQRPQSQIEYGKRSPKLKEDTNRDGNVFKCFVFKILPRFWCLLKYGLIELLEAGCTCYDAISLGDYNTQSKATGD